MFLPQRNSSSSSPLPDRGTDGQRGAGSYEQILIVDDDIEICRLNWDFLSDVGYKAEIAVSGEAALKLMQQRHFDLLLTDYKMPGLNGVELVKRLRAKDLHIPVIMTSGSIIPTQVVTELGQVSVLPKPYSFETLLSVVELALDETASDPLSFRGPVASGLLDRRLNWEGNVSI